MYEKRVSDKVNSQLSKFSAKRLGSLLGHLLSAAFKRLLRDSDVWLIVSKLRSRSQCRHATLLPCGGGNGCVTTLRETQPRRLRLARPRLGLTVIRYWM